MDAIDCIVSRRSTRKFLHKALEFDKVMMCIEAATKAPSAGNIQDYKFIIVTEREIINQISEHCSEQYWISDAPVVIIVVADTEISESYFGLRGQRLYAVQDSAAATQNIILTAHALGLGSCWIGSFDEGYIQDLMGLPETARPQSIIPLGYQAESPPDRHEKPLRAMVSFNKYGASIKNMNTLMNEYNKEIERIYKKIEKESDSAFYKIKKHTKKFYDKTKEDIKRQREKEKRKYEE